MIARLLGAIAVAAAAAAGVGAGQGEGRGVPGQLVAAGVRRAGPRVLQGRADRRRDHPADRRPAERLRPDHEPDRRLVGAGHDRGHERQPEEARRRDVHLGERPERPVPDGAVRRAARRERALARRPQGQEDHVGARAGERHDGEGGARRGRPEGGRLHARPARHGPARQRDDRRHVRRRLHARAERRRDAQERRRDDARSGRDREVHPRRSDRERLGRRRRDLDRFHEGPAGRRAALRRRPG